MTAMIGLVSSIILSFILCKRIRCVVDSLVVTHVLANKSGVLWWLRHVRSTGGPNVIYRSIPLYNVIDRN